MQIKPLSPKRPELLSYPIIYERTEAAAKNSLSGRRILRFDLDEYASDRLLYIICIKALKQSFTWNVPFSLC